MINLLYFIFSFKRSVTKYGISSFTIQEINYWSNTYMEWYSNTNYIKQYTEY